MKKLMFALVLAMFFAGLFAQVPQGITHQAVIRNTQGELVTNQDIGIQVSIIQGSVNGDAVYAETHSITSNAHGLITYVIGQGDPEPDFQVGDFENIDWADGPYFLKTVVDLAGGKNYVITGTTQFLSVPYALHAKTAEKLVGSISSNILPPKAIALEATDVTPFSATLNGIVNAEGFLTEVVFEWGETTNYGNTVTAIQSPVAGSADVEASAEIDELIPGTQYHFRLRASNAVNVINSDNIEFSALATTPQITTYPVTNIMNNSAMGGGEVTFDGGSPVTSRGVVWSTFENPTIDNNEGITYNGTGVGEFSSEMTGLNHATTYYVRAYATNAIGSSYGNEKSFSTRDGIIVLNTIGAREVTDISAISGGNISDDGGANVTARGIVWSTSDNPTIDNNEGMTNDGTGIGEFESSMSGLTPQTTYYVRAYATNAFGSVYGQEVMFETYSEMISDIDGNTYGTVIIGTQEWMAENLKTTKYRDGTPILNLPEDNDWINNTSGAYVWYDNDINWKDKYGALYNLHAVKNAKGLCPAGWLVPSQQELNVLIDYLGGKNVAGGKMKSTLTEPEPHPRWDSPNTDATNESNWSGLPGGGRIAFAEGTDYPTYTIFLGIGRVGEWWLIADWYGLFSLYFADGELDQGAFEFSHFFGHSVRCIKSPEGYNPLIITTKEVTDITSTSAVSGGEVVSDGGALVSARGVVWSTSENPTLEESDGYTTDGDVIGEFSSQLTGLAAVTTYYVRAYATNSDGTAYGNEISFETISFLCGTSTVVDGDGNEYSTVLIGSQCWIGENLKTSKYSNDIAIDFPLNNNDWEYNTAGAYSIYPHTQIDGLNSDQEVLNAYGALYNWHAVNNSNGLCPVGWRVPDDADFTALFSHLGGESLAGGKMKSTLTSPGDSHPRWEDPNTGANNESNWSGLPGGYRAGTGISYDVGVIGNWWSTTAANPTGKISRRLEYKSGGVILEPLLDNYGVSVRCIEDQPEDPCSHFPSEGCCDGNVLVYCYEGELYFFDCGTDVCGWDATWSVFDCGGSDPVPDGIQLVCPSKNLWILDDSR